MPWRPQGPGPRRAHASRRRRARSRPAGGSATNRGEIHGTLDASRSGEAVLEATQTYSDCRPNERLTVSGAPSTTATGRARFADGRLADVQTARVAGAVSYVSTTDGSGQCAVDVTVTFDRSAHGSATGTACDRSVDVSF